MDRVWYRWLILVGALTACAGSPSSGRLPHDKMAKSLLEGDTYVAFSPDLRALVFRRCIEHQGAERCELTLVEGDKVQTVTHEQLEPRLDALDTENLTIRGRNTSGGRLSAEYGTPNWRYSLRGCTFELRYEQSPSADWEIPLYAVHFAGDVRIAGAYGSFQQRNLIAFRIRHARPHGWATSWLIFRRPTREIAGDIRAIPALSGEVGTVEMLAPIRRSKRSPPPPPPPPPPVVVSPPPPRPLPAPPPFVVRPLGPNDRACTTSKQQCKSNERCAAPEETMWNACGAPRPPRCAVGWTGDHCGHCFQSCTSDDQCPGGACNGAYCVSPRRCSMIRRPQP